MDALCICPSIMVLSYFPTAYYNHRLMGFCIKHCGMAPCNPVVDDSLCILLNFEAGIEISHGPLTARNPLWIQNRDPLYR